MTNTTKEVTAMKEKKKPGPKPTVPQDRTQMSVRLTQEVMDRYHRMMYWAARGRNFQTLAEKAIIDALDRIEKEENNGKPWPPIPTK